MQRNYVVTSVLEYKHYEYVFLTQDRYIYCFLTCRIPSDESKLLVLSNYIICSIWREKLEIYQVKGRESPKRLLYVYNQ